MSKDRAPKEILKDKRTLLEKAREEASASMAKKIATLQQQNEEQKRLREYRLRNILNIGNDL